MRCPFRLWGLALKAAILSPRTIRTLAFDSSLVMPIVRRPERAAPSTAGTEPVPPTSHDFACAAATCGAPPGPPPPPPPPPFRPGAAPAGAAKEEKTERGGGPPPPPPPLFVLEGGGGKPKKGEV